MSQRSHRLLSLLIMLTMALIFWGCKETKSSDATKSAKDIQTETEKFYEDAKAKAQASNGPGVPALWKISDEDSEVFLFGTVHLLRSDTVWENDIISQAFNGSDRLYMEADITSSESQKKMLELIRDLGELPVGETLYEHMDVGDAYKFKKALEKIDFDPKALENLQPWFASLQVAQFQMIQSGYNPLSGVEIKLITRANKDAKTFGYFETLEDQMEVLAGGDFDEQIDGLVAFSAQIEDGTAALDLLVDEWVDGDVEGLGALISVPEILGSKEAYDRFLTQRNRNWIPQIIDILEEPGSSFVAVGAAHLAGPDSVVFMLEDEGIVVEKVQ